MDWLKPHVDDSMLWEIADSDYGFDRESNFEALLPIRDRQEIPVPLGWIPIEVLNLMRWSEPEHVTPPGGRGTRGHLIRAFCCAVLLRAADEPETRGYIHAENDTLIQMIASVLYLGREATESASRFLCWRILRLPLWEGEYPFFALGLLLLRAALFRQGEEGSELKLLAEWVVREETRSRHSSLMPPVSEDWLFGLTLFDQRHEAWRRAAQDVLLDASKAFPRPAEAAMREVASHLAPEAA